MSVTPAVWIALDGLSFPELATNRGVWTSVGRLQGGVWQGGELREGVWQIGVKQERDVWVGVRQEGELCVGVWHGGEVGVGERQVGDVMGVRLGLPFEVETPRLSTTVEA